MVSWDSQTIGTSRLRSDACRPHYFGPEIGWLETPILGRSELANPRTGPLIIEEYDATCIVPPGATVQIDGGGNIIIELT